jgi:hypothetical protein
MLKRILAGLGALVMAAGLSLGLTSQAGASVVPHHSYTLDYRNHYVAPKPVYRWEYVRYVPSFDGCSGTVVTGYKWEWVNTGYTGYQWENIPQYQRCAASWDHVYYHWADVIVGWTRGYWNRDYYRSYR